MPIKQKWLIPNDYNQDTSWVICTMCIPNTQQWRGIVSGAIYNLSRGRHWDESTGIIKDAQSIGRDIYDSMAIDCNDSLGRIADALESIDNKTQELYTLAEIIDNLGDSTLTDIVDLTDLITWVANLLPNAPNIALPVGDWVSMWIVGRRHREMMLQFAAANTALRGLVAATTGEVGVEVIDEVTDTFFETLTGLITTAGAIGDVGTGLAAIAALFMGDDPVYPISDPDNSTILRASVNNTNVLKQTIVNNVNLEICCFNPEGYPQEDVTEVEQATIQVPPTTWAGTMAEFQTHKCEAANFLFDAYVQWLQSANGLIPFIEQGVGGLLAMFANVMPDPWGFSMLAENVSTMFYWLLEQVSDFVAFSTLLDDYVSAIESNREDIVCALFESISPDGARVAIADVLEDIAPTPYPDGFITMQVENLFTNTVLNLLFEDNDTTEGWPTTTSCSNCQVCLECEVQSGAYVQMGSHELQNDCSYNVLSEQQGTLRHIAIWHTGGVDRMIDMSDVTGWVASGNPDVDDHAFEIYQSDATLSYRGTTPPTQAYLGETVIIQGSYTSQISANICATES